MLVERFSHKPTALARSTLAGNGNSLRSSEEAWMNAIAIAIEAVSNAHRWLRNQLVSLGTAPDFVVLEVTGRLPERRARRRGLRGWMQRRLGPSQVSLEEWRERLRILAADRRIQGVILTVGDLQAGLPALESLRHSLDGLRRSGKRLIAYLVRANLRSYYLASVADAVVAPESAELALHGLRRETTFLRHTLDRLGIVPQLHRLAEYKSAANRVLFPAMPEPQREMLNAILESLYAELITAMAAARRCPAEAMRQAIDRGLLSAAEAAHRGLLDRVAFADQLPTWLAPHPHPARIAPWEQARRRLRQPYRRRSLARHAIAVVPLTGTIVLGESRELPVPLPLVGQQFAGQETVARALRRAEELPHVKAVVLYVDSPGGSAVASDLLWREVRRLQARKPVVVAMGNVAASGGYYVACGARYIVAAATTLTGSIGVIAGKLNVRGLFEKAGARREIVSRGATAAMPSLFASYTEAEWQILQQWMAEIYGRFLARVAAGRRQPLEAVEAVARGRVWTGRQALQHGLVDEIGDFETAVRQAKALAGLGLDDEVPLLTVRAPRPSRWPAASAATWPATLRCVRSLLSEHALVLMPPDVQLD
jgi:protease-4